MRSASSSIKFIEGKTTQAQSNNNKQKEFFVRYLNKKKNEKLTQSIEQTLALMHKAKSKGENTKIGQGSG